MKHLHVLHVRHAAVKVKNVLNKLQWSCLTAQLPINDHFKLELYEQQTKGDGSLSAFIYVSQFTAQMRSQMNR